MWLSTFSPLLSEVAGKAQPDPRFPLKIDSSKSASGSDIAVFRLVRSVPESYLLSTKSESQ
jgi:hypothetical protein